ncbi:MAG: hypothetical protein KIT22_02020 [Verrucomicrobiae bacterium]|nr:hypothetical protein [Verrucomicrobiae bacterium]
MNALLEQNFRHHPPVGDAAQRHQHIRTAAAAFADLVDQTLPDGAGRERALARTKIEEAMMWANAGIARHTPRPAEPGK